MRIAYVYARKLSGQPSAGFEAMLPINMAYNFNPNEVPHQPVTGTRWKVSTTGVPGQEDSADSVHEQQPPVREEDEAFMKHNKNLMCSTERNTKMAERIAFDADSIDRFAFILSHKLRAPVANALGLVELLGKGVVSAEERKSCEDYLFAAVQQIDLEISKLNGILLEYRERVAGSEQKNAPSAD